MTDRAGRRGAVSIAAIAAIAAGLMGCQSNEDAAPLPSVDGGVVDVQVDVQLQPDAAVDAVGEVAADATDEVAADATDEVAADAGCFVVAQRAAPVPVDMYVMVDQSGSMSEALSSGGTKWHSVVTALDDFGASAADPGSLGIALGYFGDIDVVDECPSSLYATPDVPLAPLNATVTFDAMQMSQLDALSTSLAIHMPSTDTPTFPAVQGMLEYAKAVQLASPSHKVIAVLATDGDPLSACDDTVADVAQLFHDAALGDPPIDGYVIGVGTSYSNLTTIAAGAGANRFFQVDQSAAQFEATMNVIRGLALGCTFQVPSGADAGALDPSTLNLRYTPPSGPAVVLPVVATAADCDALSGGWYYSGVATAPQGIVLCPASCALVQAGGASGEIDLVTACGTP